MKSTKRALRRHHRQRMFRRALRSLVLPREWDAMAKRQRALRWSNNLKKCSCWMCGLPRKYFGTLPRQEQRLHQGADDEEAVG
jgi:hypothetical protein